jgi:hypothetical protein
MHFILYYIDLSTHIWMNLSGKILEVKVTFTFFVKEFHNASYFSLRGLYFQRPNMIFKISIRNISISVFIKLSENLVNLNWPLKYFVFNFLKYLLNSIIVDCFIGNFDFLKITINFRRWRISSYSMI